VSDDQRVTPRSDEDVRRIAARMKTEYKVVRRRPVNIIGCLEADTVRTIYGPRKLHFRVVDDRELGRPDGKTEFAKGEITITVKRSVYNDAKMGVGRARMTLAHELAHAVMHHGAPLFRLLDAKGATDLAKERAYESAEHQAKVFAAAFLIHDEDAAQMRDAEEIAIEFGVSKQAAEICFERLTAKRARALSAERVRKMADEAKAILAGSRKTTARSNPDRMPIMNYLPDTCTACGQKTLISFGHKVHCHSCRFSGDQKPDGD
jgi:Zn-dependent peptidase ImmA (M78 family)